MTTGDSHNDRMRMLGMIAAPAKGTPEWDRLLKELESNPAAAKGEAGRRYKIARATVLAQMNSGAGKLADKALREFLAEYNHRTWHYGLRRLPISFNVLEPFFTYEQEHNCWRLLPEIDYLFSIEDFIDFSTQPTTQAASILEAGSLKEGVIYNYSAYDDPTILSFQMDDGVEYVVAGVSMIRRGPELTILLIAGEKGGQKINTQSLESAVRYSDVVPDEALPEEPITLDGAPDYVKVYAACRFDLDAMTLQVRYLLTDAGRYRTVQTDDSAGLGPLTEEKRSERLKNDVEKLDRRATLWELAKTAVLLPSYVQARIDFVRAESQGTALANQATQSLKVRRAIERVDPTSKILYRRISAVRIIRPAAHVPAEVGRTYTPPRFMVPVQGFWRVFTDASTIGHDEAGNPIVGKTWVKAHARYADRPEAAKVVYIKSSLSYARRQLANYRRKLFGGEDSLPATTPPTPSEASVHSDSPGYLYVFRSPAHGRDIYKVGHTHRDPEIRARELSSTTGSPVPFLVVQAWAVSAPSTAELAAHSALAQYRLASNREFFVGQYATLRLVIETAIERWVV